MLGAQTRNQRTIVIFVGVLIFLSIFVGLVYNHLDSIQLPSRPQPPVEIEDTIGDTIEETIEIPSADKHNEDVRETYIKEIYSPSIKVDQPKYKPFGAFEFELPEESPEGPSRWRESLGEKLCIIDLDSRGFHEPGQIFADEPMSWAAGKPEPHGLSLGVLNHWLYAKIHGYKYYYIEIEQFEDRRDSWKKPPVMAEILKDHEVCLYLDSDAIFHHLDLPFEWMMNRWDLHKDSNSLALAADPTHKNNEDKFGKVYLNTGFIVAQNNPKTFEIFDAWQACPEEGGAHPECNEFKYNRPGKPTDQGGFGTYIRYDFPDDIKELQCTEANGFPESKSGCDGKFIKHLWTGKHDWLNIAVGQQIPGNYLEIFHQQYLAEKKDFFWTEAQLMAGETHKMFHKDP